MKRIYNYILLGNMLTPVMSFVLGCMFFLWMIVVLKSAGLDVLPRYVISLVVAGVMTGLILYLLAPGSNDLDHNGSH